MTDERRVFLDTASVPEFFINGLHDVHNLGSVSRFVWFLLRTGPNGEHIREAALSTIIPNDMITQLLILAARRAGSPSAVEQAILSLSMH